jgi:hypothetical protein
MEKLIGGMMMSLDDDEKLMAEANIPDNYYNSLWKEAFEKAEETNGESLTEMADWASWDLNGLDI